jgi:tetratricopeptide (TPR) repeat protein/tRNA A-37 threonylcarbamoyl transferase component Bud32
MSAESVLPQIACPAPEEWSRWPEGKPPLHPDRVEAMSRHLDECWSCQQRQDGRDHEDLEAIDPASVRYFGDYELLEEIGRGGMGVVYKARQIKLNRLVALKMIVGAGFVSKDAVRRFRFEAEAAANIQHPNIVRVHEVGEHDGLPYFSMELIEGKSLKERVNKAARTRAARREAAALVARIARAIHAAHQRGVIHRDLKPANILIDTDGEPHVTDFGLARRIEGDSGLSHSGAIMGSPSYMAPEQAAGKIHEITTAVDIYGLGAILYELLTGEPPFKGSTELETARLVQEQEPRRLRSFDARIERDLETICLKCLEKDPRRRFGTAEALADHLDLWLQGKPVPVRRTSVFERAVKWARRKPAIAALSAALLAAVVLGGMGWFWVQRDRTAQQVETARAVNQALDESLFALGRAKEAPDDLIQSAKAISEALSAARHAERLLKEREAEPNLRERVQSAIRHAEAMARDRWMLDRLETLYSQFFFPDDRFNPKEAIPNYAQAFREYGIDLEALNATEAAARIQNSPIRAKLLSAVDWWATLAEPPLATHLFQIVTLVDTDPYRTIVRLALHSRSEYDKTLRGAAYAPEAAALPPDLALGLAFSLMGTDRRKAESILQTLWQNHPEDYWVNFHFGILWATSNPQRPDESIRYFTAAGALRPNNPLPYLILAELLEKKGDRNGAIASYRRVVHSLPNNVQAHLRLGMLLERAGDDEGARVEYRAALDLAPDPKTFQSEPKTASGRAAEVIEMLADFARSIGLAADAADAHFEIGRAKRGVGEGKAAEAEFREAIRLRPDFADAHTLLGSTLADMRNLGEAERETREAVRLEPASPISHFGHGMVLLVRNKLDEAISEIRIAIRLAPPGAPKRDAQMGLAQALTLKGDHKAVATVYRDILQSEPGSLKALIGLGNALARQRKYDEAISPLRAAITIAPESAEAHATLAAALADQGKLPDAIAEVRKTVGSRPKGDAYRSMLAEMLFMANDHDGAEAEARAALAINHDDAAAHSVLGRVFVLKNQADAAMVEFRETVHLAPTNATARVSLSFLLRLQGKLDEAVKEARAAVECAPKLFEAHEILADTLLVKGDNRGAADAYRNALALQPESFACRVKLAAALDRQGNLKAAAEELRSAVWISPSDPFARANLGNALERLGDWRGAADAYGELARLKPDDPESRYKLGGMLSNIGKAEAAAASLREALRLRPGWPEARNDLGYALQLQGELRRAAAEYREAIRLKPDYAIAHSNLGAVLHDLGESSPAEAEFRKTVRLQPELALPHCQLGLSLQHSGRLEEAIVELRRGHELGSKDPRWAYPSAGWVRDCESLLALESRLPGVLRGDDRPSDAYERRLLAELCRARGRYGTAARLREEALASIPSPASDLLHEAARSAALAASGRGTDQPALDPAARARWRSKALGWLRAELEAIARLDREQAKAIPSLAPNLRRCRSDPDLAGLRDEAALQGLSEAERAPCRKLWANLDLLLLDAVFPDKPFTTGDETDRTQFQTEGPARSRP